MDELEELLRATLPQLAGAPAAEKLTYREAFVRHAGIDPFLDGAATLRRRARELGVAVGAPDAKRGQGDGASSRAGDGDTVAADWPREEWLHLLLATVVEPKLGRGRVSYVHDFPAAEAALARVRPGDPPLAERFEAFVDGVELANGYHELADPEEQGRRFAADLAARRERGLPEKATDAHLIAALSHGLPDCAGVALGFDRLAMLAAGVDSIDQVIAFPIDRA
jgi:lysyl-tRNA synthetase class 2